MSKYLLFLVFTSYCFIVYGQDYIVKTENISVEDGLSNRFVRSIVQDEEGFMWFATQYGLNRYDGDQFKIFTREKNGLQSNFIDKVYVDADSNLWVAHTLNSNNPRSFHAVDIFNPRTFEVQPAEQKMQEALPFNIKELYSIYPSLTNHWLYLLTNRGEIYIYKGAGKFDLYYKHDKATIIHGLVIGNRFDWIYCFDELLVLNKKREVINRGTIDDDGLILDSKFVEEIGDSAVFFSSYPNSRNPKIWYWKVDSIPLERSGKEFIPLRGVESWNLKKLATLNYRIFIKKDELQLVDRNRQAFYKTKLKDESTIRSLYVDNQDNIWMASTISGIIKISCLKNKFKTYLTTQSIRGIMPMQTDSLFMVNTMKNAYLLNLQTDTIQELETKTNGRALCKSRDKKSMWISTTRMGLLKMNLATLDEEETYTYRSVDKTNSISMNIGWAIHEDKNGTVWLGTSGGLAYLEKRADSLKIYRRMNRYPKLSASIVTYFYENEKGLWIASSGGLFLMNNEQEIIRHYSKNRATPFYLPHEHILHIHEDTTGIFWLSTRGGGIIKLNLETGAYQQFTTQEGLSHNLVYAILEDARHNFWMSSDYGLMRFNPRTHVVNTYLPNDGLPHEEFNHPSFYKSSNGHLYFGGIKGGVIVNPELFYDDELLDIPLRITQYQYFNGNTNTLEDKTQEIIKNQAIVLGHTDRFFTLSFSLLDYKKKEGHVYAYKIDGLDEDWNFIDANVIRINALNAGNYTLHVKAQGNNGKWSTSQIKIPILVKQPFYLTRGFIALMVLAIIFLVVVYFKWRVIRLRKAKAALELEVQKRTQKIEQQADELRELDNVKSRFFANISHELRTPLTLIMGPVNAILERKYGKDWDKVDEVLEMVKRNSFQLQRLIEEILVLSKIDAQYVEVKERSIALFPFIRRLFFAFDAQAELKQINYQLNYQLDEELVLVLDDNKVEKIINNLLSNALKYTNPKGTIQFNIWEEEKTNECVQICLQVVDTGKGISKKDLPHIFDRYYQSKEKDAIIEGGTGIGLALAYEFAQILGGSLTVESSLRKGSTFTFTMALKPSSQFIEKLEEPENKSLLVEGIIKNDDQNKSTILVVEDNVDMQAFIVDLVGMNHQIITAENGKIALTILEDPTINIDLILSDVMMPEMDGFQLLSRLKTEEQWQQIPVIMLTARSGLEDKLSALKIGVDDYLSKPFSSEELLVRIHNLLQNYKQRAIWKTEIEEEFVDKELVAKEERIPVKGAWLNELEQIAKHQVGNSQFGISRLADDLNISERQLRRKIKAQTGMTPHRYLTLIKLETARNYLETQKYQTVAEVAYKVGFTNASHFSKIYQEQYAKRPIEYLRNQIYD